MLAAMDMRAISHASSASSESVAEGESAESVWRARFCSERLMGRWPGTAMLAETEATRAAMRSCWEYIFACWVVVEVG